MDFKDIRLGKVYWCVIKASVVDPEKKDKPDFLMHIAKGRVISKGMQYEDDTNSIVRFVEVAGQRIKSDHIFTDPLEAILKLEKMMSEMRRGLKEIPSEA